MTFSQHIPNSTGPLIQNRKFHSASQRRLNSTTDFDGHWEIVYEKPFDVIIADTESALQLKSLKMLV